MRVGIASDLLPLAWELVRTSPKAQFSGAIRQRRRVNKVSALEIYRRGVTHFPRGMK